MDEGTAPSLQNSFFNQVRKDRVRVAVVLNSGQKISGHVKAFDKFTLLVDTRNGEQMVFKHAIATVSVQGPSEGRTKGAPEAREKGADPRHRFGNFIDFEKKPE